MHKTSTPYHSVEARKKINPLKNWLALFHIFNNAIISTGSLICNEGAALTVAHKFTTAFLFVSTCLLHVNMEQQSTTEASVRASRAKISEGTRGNSEAEGKTCGDLGKDGGEADHDYQLMPTLPPPTSASLSRAGS